MFMEPHTTLIVGSDGQIGRAMNEYLRKTGVSVLGTTRWHDTTDERRQFLDLTQHPETWEPAQPIAAAVICAAQASVDTCRRDPKSSSQVNVEGTVRLVENLVARGAFVIYLSTDQVFDGTIPLRSPDDAPCPRNEYGRQKAETERRLLQLGNAVAIVRLSRVLGSIPSPLAGWTVSLKRGEIIHPFSDMVFAPLPVSFVVSSLRLLMERRLPGMWHLSGDVDTSYADAATFGAEILGVDPDLVRPVLTRQVDPDREHVAAHTTLDISRGLSTFGIRPPDTRWTIEKAFLHPQSLVGDEPLVWPT